MANRRSIRRLIEPGNLRTQSKLKVRNSLVDRTSTAKLRNAKSFRSLEPACVTLLPQIRLSLDLGSRILIPCSQNVEPFFLRQHRSSHGPQILITVPKSPIFLVSQCRPDFRSHVSALIFFRNTLTLISARILPAVIAV